jgi:hypothetical protein
LRLRKGHFCARNFSVLRWKNQRISYSPKFAARALDERADLLQEKVRASSDRKRLESRRGEARLAGGGEIALALRALMPGVMFHPHVLIDRKVIKGVSL